MIKFEHTITPSPKEMEFVIEGMRNPMESWDQSDSGMKIVEEEDDVRIYKWILGHNDWNLMKRLCKAGSDERKFMRQMPVYVRITAPLYWWKEFDTYKVGTVSNSCSTMHKIHSKEFTLADFSWEHLTGCVFGGVSPQVNLNSTIKTLNAARNKFLETNDKEYWWQMIQLLPSSYNQTRNITLNYEVLHNMYQARKYHKQDEWRVGFCDWCKSLPYSEFITEEWDVADE